MRGLRASKWRVLRVSEGGESVVSLELLYYINIIYQSGLSSAFLSSSCGGFTKQHAKLQGSFEPRSEDLARHEGFRRLGCSGTSSFEKAR